MRRHDQLDILIAHGKQVIQTASPGRDDRAAAPIAPVSATVESFDGGFAAEAAWLGCPEGREGVEAVGIGGGFVAEDHDAARAGVEKDVEPAVGGDHGAGEAEPCETGRLACHGGHAGGG